MHDSAEALTAIVSKIATITNVNDSIDEVESFDEEESDEQLFAYYQRRE